MSAGRILVVDDDPQIRRVMRVTLTAQGYEVDDALVRELSQVAASQVAFRYGDKVIRSTLSPVQEAELNPQRVEMQGSARPAPPRTAPGDVSR
jgi:CheY-like chemotaxis protein